MEGIREDLQLQLREMGIEQLSDVQNACIPAIASGRDVFCTAHTASGKTLMYLLPLISKLEIQTANKHKPRILILTPTRELALQIAEQARFLLRRTEGIRTFALVGGVRMDIQIRQFSKGADIVIAAPGRLKDHIRRHTFKPDACDMLVLDETDELISMGFEQDVRDIISILPAHQTVLCSATSDEKTEDFAKEILHDQFVYHASDDRVKEQKIRCLAAVCSTQNRFSALCRCLHKAQGPCYVFVNTIRTADMLSRRLSETGMACAVMHSERTASERKKTMQDFRSGRTDVLVTTDVLARGIDVPQADTVILYELPDTDEQAVHRIGRTSRTASTGTAYILCTEKQRSRLEPIAFAAGQKIRQISFREI